MTLDVVSSLLNAFALLLPEMILALAACVLFLGGTFRRDRNLWGIVALVSLAAALLALALAPRPGGERTALFTSPIFVDRLAFWITAAAIVGGFVLVLSSWEDVANEHAAEYHACLLLIIAGVCVTASANELVTLFLGLELISIPTYVLLYLPRSTLGTQEAAMKYFLLSVFSSAMLLFGFSYLYGLAGTTNIPAITLALGTARGSLPAVAQIALVMVIAGMGFRITAVPFHFYAPDVYQGTTNSAAALLSFIPKLAGFTVLIRILGDLPSPLLGPGVTVGTALGAQVPNLLWILAAATMTIGNVLALLQDNLRRLLAYSSVAHTGYMLIALAAIPSLYGGKDPPSLTGGVDAIVFYLIAYGGMTVGAFTLLGYLSRSDRPVEKVDDLAGLGTTHPGLALLMMLFLFSLTGIPLTAGFAGKVLVLGSAISVPPGDTARLFRILAVIGILNAALASWYYLRIVAVMYLRGALRPLPKVFSWPGIAALALCGIITLGAGIWPWSLLKPARETMPQVSRDATQTGGNIVGD